MTSSYKSYPSAQQLANGRPAEFELIGHCQHGQKLAQSLYQMVCKLAEDHDDPNIGLTWSRPLGSIGSFYIYTGNGKITEEYIRENLLLRNMVWCLKWQGYAPGSGDEYCIISLQWATPEAFCY
jgi:hypothetical protein